MSAGFTPGPWKVARDADDVGNRRVVSFHPSAVAKVYGDEPVDEDNKAIANAHLIAAAPALYDVADEFLCSLELLERHGPHLACADGEFISASTLTDRAEALRAALAQARGDLVDPLEQVRS